MPQTQKKAEAPRQPVEIEHIKPKIPEQRMKEELEKIPILSREFYEQTLKKMGLKATPEEILVMYELLGPTTTRVISENDFLLLGESGLVKNAEDLRRYGKELIDLDRRIDVTQIPRIARIKPSLREFLSKIAQNNGIKSPEDYRQAWDAIIRLASFEYTLSFMLDKGVVQSAADLDNLVKLYDSSNRALVYRAEIPGIHNLPAPLLYPNLEKAGLLNFDSHLERPTFDDLVGNRLINYYLPLLVKNGRLKSPEDLRKLREIYESDMPHIENITYKIRDLCGYQDPMVGGFRDYDISLLQRCIIPIAKSGVINTAEELIEWVSEARKADVLFREILSQSYVPINLIRAVEENIAKANVVKTPQDLSKIWLDLAKNPHLIEVVGYASPEELPEELSQLKPQNFSAQLVELYVKKIAEWVDFPLEKITQTQKEQLAKMLPGLEFILQNQEVRTLVKHGLENTFQKFYDSLEENKQALKEMNKLGIDTDVFVYHKGIDKAVFKKTLTGIEKLEAGKEHIEDRFYDVINQLFNNPKGEIFKKPGRILSDVMQLQQFDARDYQTGEERVGILIAMMKSDEEWLKGAISVLETHLKTVGQQGSVVVDSEEMKQEARTALFHVQEIKRLLGMPVKPMKGEKGEITISIKLSDKNPLTALTNGNDSGCCVALNRSNRWTLPIYMKDMATQIAEIFVIKEGKENRIGQAWLFAGRIEKESALIIDSINITSSYRNMNEIYEASIEFVKDFAEKAGFKNIVMGTNYNDAYPYAEKKFERKIMELEKIHTFDENIYSDTLQRMCVFVIR